MVRHAEASNDYLYLLSAKAPKRLEKNNSKTYHGIYRNTLKMKAYNLTTPADVYKVIFKGLAKVIGLSWDLCASIISTFIFVFFFSLLHCLPYCHHREYKRDDNNVLNEDIIEKSLHSKCEVNGEMAVLLKCKHKCGRMLISLYKYTHLA
uniref:Uncharacterized protein n=1 Tax=Glossina brevipalpis TaxID=37001 RepID=A0A1A9WEF0_9MUSC